VKILFFIENLYSGGKERRLVELLKGLQSYPNIKSELVLTRKEIHYKEILKLNLKIHVIERKGLKKDPRLFYKFFKIAQKSKPDLIHVWGNMVAIYALPAKLFLNIPMMNSQITDAPLNPSGGFLGPKLPFHFSDVILSNSRAGIGSYKPPLNKSRVIYNGFDFKRIANLEKPEAIRIRFNIKTKFVVGMVASFSQLKDYKTYLKAAIAVSEIRDDVSFLCVGLGNSKKYQRMVPEHIKEKILFLGPQSNVENIMNICDIGVLASFSEGIPNTIMEFMALAKPVVVTSGGGIKELVSKDVGFVVTQQNFAEFVDKIVFILNNSKLRLSMGRKGKAIIVKKFNLDQMVNSYLSEYEKTLNRITKNLLYGKNE